MNEGSALTFKRSAHLREFTQHSEYGTEIAQIAFGLVGAKRLKSVLIDVS